MWGALVPIPFVHIIAKVGHRDYKKESLTGTFFRSRHFPCTQRIVRRASSGDIDVERCSVPRAAGRDACLESRGPTSVLGAIISGGAGGNRTAGGAALT